MSSVGAKSEDFKPLGALARFVCLVRQRDPATNGVLGWGIDQALNLGFSVEAVGFDPQAMRFRRWR